MIKSCWQESLSGKKHIRGFGVMRDYYKDPSGTANALDADGWLHTGDIGRFDENGCLHFIGRLKDIIVRGGENISPSKIEELLLELDWAKGGKSFLCLTSTTEIKGKVTSNIMLNLPAGQVVSTPRASVMYIVTEYGIADLKNKSIPDRVHAMIRIAHPDYREELTKQAIAAGLITE